MEKVSIKNSMNNYLNNLKPFTIKKLIKCGLILLNLISLFFIVIYSVIHKESVAANVFGIIMILTFIIDIIYAAATKRKSGIIILLVQVLLIALIYGINAIYMFNWNLYSIAVPGFAALALIIIFSLFLVISDLLGIEYKPRIFKNEKSSGKFYNIINYVFLLVVPAALILLTIIANELVNNRDYSNWEYISYLLSFTFIFVVVAMVSAVLGILIKQKKLLKNISLTVVVLIMGSYCLYSFCTPYFILGNDIENAKISFAKAFGENALTTTENMRQNIVSVPDILFGITTKNIKMDTDIKYYESFEGDDAGIQLYYDVYYPDFETGNKSVLVRMHGRSCDKSNSNNCQINKYFASRGYIVYDIQYGDFNEKQESGYKREVHNNMDIYQNYIRKFFIYAQQNNTYGAKFDSVFISGHSYGGSMTCAFGLSFNNNIAEYDNLGITVKGIIPYYPYGNLIDEGFDFHYNVNENSVPCLMIMGSHDALRSVSWELEYFYEKAGNTNYAVLNFSYATHSFDTYFMNYANQTCIYFIERFMNTFK